MSRTQTYRSLGVNVSIICPDNPFPPKDNDGKDNFNHLIFEAGIDNAIYRGGKGLSLFRALFAEAVEKACNITPEVEEVKNKKGEVMKDDEGQPRLKFVYDESERVERALAKSNRTIESFQDVANALSTQLACDPTVKERGPVEPKTPPKTVYSIVDQLIASGAATQVAADLSKLLGRTVETDRESLAKAIHEDQLAEIRKAKNKYMPVAAVTPAS